MAKQKNLVIVESPTKAKTISKFLGVDFIVESSFGHIRDLPKSKMGVDVEHNFEPHYIVPRTNQKRVTALKKTASKAKHVYFATDEDREGEAISWHLQELLQIPEDKVQRIVFHEVTESALRDALEHPRSLYMDLVDAQQARRVLDRLVGYELSPFLWRKVAKGLSAGRVQSVVVRLLVEREREIERFIPQEYWSVDVELSQKSENNAFMAKLTKRNNETLDKFDIQNSDQATMIVDALAGAAYRVQSLEKKKVSKTPPPPFTTSTLQQESNKRLHLSAKQTMSIAQQLYEGIETGGSAEGLITYMRTDSVHLSEKFLSESKEYIKEHFGEKATTGERRYKTKSKLAQEAHEAIRPTSISRTPQSVKEHLSDTQWKLYDLIWRRALASQMADALFEATAIDVNARGSDGKDYVFRATGQVMLYDGFLKVYDTSGDEVRLPHVSDGEELDLLKLEPCQHFTKPPARYSEATLVKTLEEFGIGRPSTYAPTIGTIIERNYAQREDGRLKPTEIACMVSDLLVAHFPNIVDYAFTARMEDDLDEIAEGKKGWVPVVRTFYEPFKEHLIQKDKELTRSDIIHETTTEVCEKCGKPMLVKMGRFGKFLACSGFPECKNSKPLTTTHESDGHGEQEYDPCEKCGSKMVIKRGRFGSFLGCSAYPECKTIRSLTDKKTGISCPECGSGTVIQKRSKRKKIFYSCSRYPDCTFVSWTKPGEEEKK
ncbi:type I DNA topoisomerase [Candidatus Uhrbacteria bacterium]|nr:type I DNA topoisomerase [Candidatus Uhrbacteria bacterium]